MKEVESLKSYFSFAITTLLNRLHSDDNIVRHQPLLKTGSLDNAIREFSLA